MVIADAIFSQFTTALGGQDIILTLLAIPFVYTIAFVFYRIAV